jgi:hypothetical protein
MAGPTDLVAGCCQDRRMKDNVLIETRCGGGKIARYQRDREGFCHNGDSYEDGYD